MGLGFVGAGATGWLIAGAIGLTISFGTSSALSWLFVTGITPVMAATPTPESTMSETAVAASSGCKRVVVVCIALFSFSAANNAQATRDADRRP
jgi:hypothetical protein